MWSVCIIVAAHRKAELFVKGSHFLFLILFFVPEKNFFIFILHNASASLPNNILSACSICSLLLLKFGPLAPGLIPFDNLWTSSNTKGSAYPLVLLESFNQPS